jgi:RNA polymerase sigma-70 factor (ECF subfamily)
MPRADAMDAPITGAETGRRDGAATLLPVAQVVLRHYEREHIALRRFLLFTGVTDAVAQEIVQETFLRLHKHLGKNPQNINLRAWLYRVARNLALNEHASSRQRVAQPIDDESQPLHQDNNSPETIYLQGEREERIREAMARLSPAQRECLVLRTRGMKYREIAEALQISVSSVGENVQRGLEKLRELL